MKVTGVLARELGVGERVRLEHALEAVLRSVQHTDEKQRELAVACVKDLLKAQPQRKRESGAATSGSSTSRVSTITLPAMVRA